MMTRREALKTTALATAAIASLPGAIAQQDMTPSQSLITTSTGGFTLPPLPYAYDALEPHIDARTMEIHHDKHHATYVAKLNEALPAWTDFKTKFEFPNIEAVLKDLNSVPEKIRTTVRNNGGGHYNHSLFWQMMKKDGGGEPKTELAKAIETQFGSFNSFKDQFTKAALGQFGSGWAWLTIGSSDKFLKIIPTANQDSPLSIHDSQRNSNYVDASLNGGTRVTESLQLLNQIPLLGLDVWEHAYYLKYQNKRAEYITAWWNVVNWDFVAERYSKLKG